MIAAAATVATAYGISATTMNFINASEKLYANVKTNGQSYNEELRDYVVQIVSILEKYAQLYKCKPISSTLRNVEKLRKFFRRFKDDTDKEFSHIVIASMMKRQYNWKDILYLIRLPKGCEDQETRGEVISDRNLLKSNFSLFLQSILDLPEEKKFSETIIKDVEEFSDNSSMFYAAIAAIGSTLDDVDIEAHTNDGFEVKLEAVSTVEVEAKEQKV